MNLTPEQKARLDIDAALVAAAGSCRTVRPATWPPGAVATASTTTLSTRRETCIAACRIATQF
jgi:hypothetical protein